MIWSICIIGCATIVTIASICSECYWEPLDTILGIVLGIIAASILSTVLAISLEGAPTTTYEYSVTELVALNDGVSGEVSGTYFLGTGHVSSDDDLEYRFIYRAEKGMMVGERRATSVYLEYIEDGEVPRLVKYISRYDEEFWDWLLGTADTWEVFYVPEGSITNDIAIDLR